MPSQQDELPDKDCLNHKEYLENEVSGRVLEVQFDQEDSNHLHELS